MYGAILGDMIGSLYEFNNYKAKVFPLFTKQSTFTDDTLMSLAVAKAFLDAGPDAEDTVILNALVRSMVEIASHYPNCGYGGMFQQWLESEEHKPYDSFGNGSAMRVSSVAWLYRDMERVRHGAYLSAVVTHNHPEGIKGAEAIASAVFLARRGHSKDSIRSYIESEFQYDLSRSCEKIRSVLQFDETCPGSVPEAITAFLEGSNFEDVIRTAVSIGGDSDTIACMAGAIAEAFYGVPVRLKAACYMRLPHELRKTLRRFERSIIR